MSPFTRMIASEFIKARRSPMLRMAFVLLAFALAVDLALMRGLPYGQSARTIQETCRRMVSWSSLTLAFLAPLFIFLIGAGASTPEHKAQGWKHLFAQPFPRWKYAASKMVLPIAILAGTLALAVPLLGIALRVVTWRHAEFASAMPWRISFQVMAWLFLGCIAPMIFSVWIGIRFSHEGTGILGGIFAVVFAIAAGMALRGKPMVQYFVPWLQPVQAARMGLRFEMRTHEASPRAFIVGCLVMSALLLAFASWDLGRRRET